jgi:hypothetical protein
MRIKPRERRGRSFLDQSRERESRKQKKEVTVFRCAGNGA